MKKSTITIRISDKDKDYIKTQANNRQLSISEYIIQQALHPIPQEPSENRRLQAALCALQNTVSMIADPTDQKIVSERIDDVWRSLR